MSDANEQEQNTTEQERKRPLTLGRSGGRLELRKPVETAQVRQSFSHGRSKTVTVEVRKKRTIGPGPAEPGRAEPTPAVARDQQVQRPATLEPVRLGVVLPRALTEEERAGRARAVQDAAEAEEARRRADEDARKRAEEEAQRRKEEESRREVAERAGKAAAAKVAALAAAGKVAMPAEEEEEPVGAP